MEQGPNTSLEPRAYPGRDLEAMAFAPRYHAWISRYFAPYLIGNAVEVGAGTGQFTESLLARTEVRRVFALEPAANLHRELAARFDRNPRVIALNSRLDGEFDSGEAKIEAVVYCNVLEHIEDDFGEIKTAAGLLPPGGAVCIFVPALPFLMSNFDRSIGHYRRYTPGRLRSVAEQAGLRVTQLRWFDSVGILPWLIFMKWGRGGLSPGSVNLYDRWVVPWLLRLESFIAPWVGKNILMVAQRR